MNIANEKHPRLLLIDDETYFVQFFTELFQDKNVEVCAADNGQRGIDFLKEKSFDLVVIDYQLPDMLGTQILKWMREQALEVPRIMVTGYGTIDVAVEALKGGAVDFFTKPLGDPQAFVQFLIHTLELGQETEQSATRAAQSAASLIASGTHPITEESASTDLERVREMCHKLNPDMNLTRREYEVITALLRGLSNKEIASALFITERTVKNHLTQVYKKFSVDSRPQLFNKILIGLG